MCTNKLQLCQDDHMLEAYVPKYNRSKLLSVLLASAIPQICHQMTAVDNRKDSSRPKEEPFLPLSIDSVFSQHL